MVRKIVPLVAFGLIITSCVCIAPTSHPVTVKYGKLRIGGEGGERIVFAENGVGAHVKWKKHIGTPFFQLGNKSWYMLGPNPGIWPDGKIYFQDRDCIFAADMATGKVVDRYEKPERLQSRVAALDHACLVPGKKVFPLESWNGHGYTLLIIDEETKESEIGFAPYSLFAPGSYQCLFSVGEFASRKEPWHSGKGSARLLSRRIYPDVTPPGVIVALYGKKDLLITEALYLSTLKLFWDNSFKMQSPSEDAVYGLQKFDQLFVTELCYNEMFINFDGQVTSLDPLTGEINWQLPHAVWVYTKKSKDGDNLFYFYKKDQPKTIYGVDQKTGEEKLTLCLKDYHLGYGIIATSEKVFYPAASGLKHYSLQYNAFSAVDKKTGKTLWTLVLEHLEHQSALPHHEDGVLYFGNKFNFLKHYFFGSSREYAPNFDIYEKGDIPATAVPKTAFAVNAETGKVLWKLGLEGGEEAYIEKLLVKDNMVFVKSLSGWLYAIEWEKPAA